MCYSLPHKKSAAMTRVPLLVYSAILNETINYCQFFF